MSSSAERLPGLSDILGRWFKPKRTSATQDELAATHTTTGGGFEQKPVVVWTASYPLEARIVKGRLESEGIPAILQGEVMGDILGLSSGGLAKTDVLVPAPLADKALALLETALLAEEENMDGSNEIG